MHAPLTRSSLSHLSPPLTVCPPPPPAPPICTPYTPADTHTHSPHTHTHSAHLGQALDVIDAHAIVRVQNRDLPPGADAQPVAQVHSRLEGDRVQQEQGEGEVVHPEALPGQADVGLVLLMHLAQQPTCVWVSVCVGGSWGGG